MNMKRLILLGLSLLRSFVQTVHYLSLIHI